MRKAVLLAAALVAAAAAPTTAGTLPSLSVTPSKVHRGSNVHFNGYSWPANKRVQLLIGRPNSEATKFASPKADGNGHFRYTQSIKASAPTGKYVILACRNNCQVKISRNLTILP